MQQRNAVRAALVIAAAAVVSIIVLRYELTEPIEGGIPAQMLDRASTETLTPELDSAPVDRQAVTQATGLHVTVKDSSGVPVHQARVGVLPQEQVVESAMFLALSDERGGCMLPSEAVGSAWVVAVKSGFEGCVAPQSEAAGGRMSLVMHALRRVKLAARWNTGEPAAGCTLALSRTAGPGIRRSDRASSDLNLGLAKHVYEAHLDHGGLGEIAAAAGLYQVELVEPAGLLSSDSGFITIGESGGRVDLELLRLYGCALRLPSNREVLEVRSGLAVQSFVPGSRTHALADDLRRRLGVEHVAIGPCLPNAMIEWQVYFRRGGWESFVLPTGDLKSIVPHRIDAKVGEDVTGLIHVALDSLLSDLAPLRLVRMSSGVPFVKNVENGSVVRLPEGLYEVQTGNALLRPYLKGRLSLEVVRGEEALADVRVESGIKVCALMVTDELGRPMMGGGGVVANLTDDTRYMISGYVKYPVRLPISPDANYSVNVLGESLSISGADWISSGSVTICVDL